MPQEPPFYARGLRFSCARCSECCRIDPGFVFLRKSDVAMLVYALELRYTEFIKRYCRWVPTAGGGKRLSLKEKPNYDCIFWSKGCALYEARPLQCRAYPFWPSMLASREAWEAASCPGMGTGTLYSREEIEALLARQNAEPIIERER
ncbi:MAG: YkgJ family cysteine cluster protein [Treponema sp.]|nr:YkgJ family cysteine cluster protein [Treponema sp.]